MPHRAHVPRGAPGPDRAGHLGRHRRRTRGRADGIVALQRNDFVGLLDAMDGLPVTIRLLDPPLHEFLPDLTELAVKVAVAEAGGETGPEQDANRKLLAAVERMHESNPMLGLRGVRLGLVTPGLFALQVRAIAEAATEQVAAGGTRGWRSWSRWWVR